jgi:hypothetical protein
MAEMTQVAAFGIDEKGRRRRKEQMENTRGRLLLWWVVGECDTLGDVALEAFDASLEKSLFVVIEVCEWVLDFLDTGSLDNMLV